MEYREDIVVCDEQDRRQSDEVVVDRNSVGGKLFDDLVSVTNHYISRKNEIDEFNTNIISGVINFVAFFIINAAVGDEINKAVDDFSENLKEAIKFHLKEIEELRYSVSDNIG